MSTLQCKGLNTDELIGKLNILKENNVELKEKIESCINEKNVQEDFLISISHDLRTPLNTIISVIQLLNYMGYTDEVKSPKLTEYIGIIQRNSYSMLKLVNNLIDITRIERKVYAINKTNVEVISFIKSIVNSIEGYAEKKKISIKFESKTKKCVMATDAEALARIIINLLSNSIKFTNDNGNLIIKVTKYNNNLNVIVKDDGRGILEEDQEKIFNRFIKSNNNKDSEGQGSGIGLDLVNQLTRYLGGSIKLESKVNVGTEVKISLPIEIIIEKKSKDIIETSNQKIELLQVEFSDIYN